MVQLIVGSVVEWLKRQAHDQHGLASKPTHAILLCPWERHFMALSPAWWSCQAILNYSHTSIKLQVLNYSHISIKLQQYLGISGSRSG